MFKNFNDWNILKQQLDKNEPIKYIHPREVWWCSLGTNIGTEINGKNENFERPVLILKVYSTETAVILPITSKIKDNRFHYPIMAGQKKVWVSLTQIRTISTRRLLRKVDLISFQIFKEIKFKLQKYI